MRWLTSFILVVCLLGTRELLGAQEIGGGSASVAPGYDLSGLRATPCELVWRGHMEPMPRKKNYPKTVPAAVEYCLKTLNVGTLKEVALLEDDAGTHFGLGMWIRNNLGLWRGNRELVEAMGWCHPDDASGPIVTALIQYLREHPDWQARRRALRAKKTSTEE